MPGPITAGGLPLCHSRQFGRTRRLSAIVAVLDSRVTDFSFPVGTRAEFYNRIGRLLPVGTVPGTRGGGQYFGSMLSDGSLGAAPTCSET